MALKYVFEPDADARAQAAGYDPLTTPITIANESQLQLYASNYFQYDNYSNPNLSVTTDHMVVKEIAHGGGCSCSADGGQGFYTYAYLGNPNYTGDGNYDQWKMRTTTVLPDGNHEVVYTNFAGAPILDVQQELAASLPVTSITGSGSTWTINATNNYQAGNVVVISGSDQAGDNGTFVVQSATGSSFTVTNASGAASTAAGMTAQKVNRQWVSAYHYDSNGNLVWEAHPSAVTGYSESYSDLVNYSPTTGTATDVSSNSGLVDVMDYYNAGWTITGNAGIAANGSTIAAGLTAPDGQQAAFFGDNTGFIQQTLSFPTSGSYTLTAYGAQPSGASQSIKVLLDNVFQGTITPNTGSYASRTVTLSVGTAGTHTLEFQATGTGTALLDNISVNGGVSIPDYSFESPTLASGTFTYDPIGSTATAAVAGGVAGLLQDNKESQGLSGTPTNIQQVEAFGYLTQGGGTSGQSAASGVTYLPGTDTLYGQTGNGDPRVTTDSYTFYPGTTQVQQDTTTMPPISYAQDGPASSNTDTAHADVVKTYYDAYGRVEWTMDADGHVNYTGYLTADDGTGLDTGTGAVTETITDVDYNKLSTYLKQNAYPTGWAQPTGGLHIVTKFTVDGLGRTTQMVRDAGQSDAETTDYVYNDASHEIRTYPGWHQASNQYTTTGPMQVDREYFPSTVVSGTATGGSQSTLTDTVHLS